MTDPEGEKLALQKDAKRPRREAFVKRLIKSEFRSCKHVSRGVSVYDMHADLCMAIEDAQD